MDLSLGALLGVWLGYKLTTFDGWCENARYIPGGIAFQVAWTDSQKLMEFLLSLTGSLQNQFILSIVFRPLPTLELGKKNTPINQSNNES